MLAWLIQVIKGWFVEKHTCSMREIAITDECNYGCKVLACSSCGTWVVSHRAIYGCNMDVVTE